jgi:methylphosphotriester-DNA--protein-cysteine methyltransferase
MIRHTSLGDTAFKRSRNLKRLLDENEIAFAGNSKLKIYGMLTCRSGKRMKAANRVFFKSEAEAIESGYRPCGHCMPVEYKIWFKLVD